MYGPLFNASRGKREEHVENQLQGNELATYANGTRSGMPLWGQTRKIHTQLGSLKRAPGSMTECSDMSNDDMSVTRKSVARSRAPMLGEDVSFGYYELMWELRREHINTMHIKTDDHLSLFLDDSTDELTLEMRQRVREDPDNIKLLCNYASIEPDQGVAAEVLHRAFRLEPDNVDVLNGFGVVMGKVGARGRQRNHNSETDHSAHSQMVELFEQSIRWEGRSAAEPSVFSQMRKHFKKLRPDGCSGFVQLGNFLRALQKIVENEEVKREAELFMAQAMAKGTKGLESPTGRTSPSGRSARSWGSRPDSARSPPGGRPESGMVDDSARNRRSLLGAAGDELVEDEEEGEEDDEMVREDLDGTPSGVDDI